MKLPNVLNKTTAEVQLDDSTTEIIRLSNIDLGASTLIPTTAATNLSTLIFPEREIDIGLSVTLCVINLYLVLVTFYYYIKHSQENLKWTNRLCAISTFALFFGTCWYQLEIHIKNPTIVFCHVYTVVNVFGSIGNRTLVYVVLWIRQRFFYQSLALLKVTQVKFHYLSYSLLILIISLSIIQIGTLSGLPSTVNEIGCNSGTPSPFLKVFTPIVFIIVSLFQCLLLGPVLYPIYKHIKARKRGKKQERFAAIFLRLSLCTTVCIVTDLCFIGLSVQSLSPKFSFSFIPISYSINMTINVISMLVSFADSRLRFLPFLTVDEKLNTRISTIASLKSSLQKPIQEQTQTEESKLDSC